MTLTDEVLMQAVANGELRRLAELYRRYRTPLFGFLLKRTGGKRAVAEPSADADYRFTSYLEALTATDTTFIASSGTAEAVTLPRTKPKRKLPFYLAVAAGLLLVFSLGWSFGHYFGTDELDRELAANRTLVLELMKRPNSNDRIRAVTVSLDLGADPEILENLGYLLRTDENANVRLAALDALLRFSNDERVRLVSLDALASDPPEVVRIQLMETLIGLDEKRVLPYLEDIIQNDTLPRPLRDAAQHGAYRLI